MLTFSLLAVVMVVGALGVITLKQPVHAALSLVGTLLTLAVTYVTLQAHFLATIQVIVYAGAIMVLFLFVIMLLNIQGEEQQETFRWMRPLAYALGLVTAAGIAVSAFKNPTLLPDAAVISAALGGGGAAEVGEALFTDFVLAFQLVGVLLLTGIVGAVSLVQRKAEAAHVQAKSVAISSPVPGGGVAVIERSSKPVQPSSKEKPVTNRLTNNPPQQTSDTIQPAKAAAEAPAPAKSADDLKRISGVGPKLEGLLHRNGIHTFEQIANLSPAEVEKLDAKLESFKGRIERDEWLKQARDLADEKKQA